MSRDVTVSSEGGGRTSFGPMPRFASLSLDVTLMLPVRLHPHSPHFLSGSKEDPLGYILEWTAEGEGLERAGQKVGGLRLSFLL